MKPISLKFKCFGPFMDEQVIDFEDIRRFGLFLITGSTGAGKTTILDAMCMALYGESSGGKRGGLADMRCKLAGDEDVTYVEYIFEVDGARYKFYREMKKARKNLNETHNCMQLQEGEFVPLMGNPTMVAVNKRAVEILKLTAEQFRQIIILPQGQFEKLLVSNSAEKEKILTQVFHAQHWGNIVERIKGKVKAKTDALNELRSKVMLAFESEDVDSLEALQGKLEAAREGVDALKKEIAEKEAEKEKLTRAYETALEENKDFEAAESAKNAYNALAEKVSEIEAEALAIEKAKKADVIRSLYETKKTAEKNLAEASLALAKSEEAFAAAQQKENEAKNQLSSHMEKGEEIEQSKQTKTLMENAKGVYETLTEKQCAYAKAQQKEETVKQQLQVAEEAYTQASAAHTAECKTRDTCMDVLQEATRIYNQGAAARLGEALTATGGPCPVCGSLEHPRIAHRTADERVVTDAELSELNSHLNTATTAVTEAEKEKTQKQAELETCRNAHDQAKHYLAERKAEYESARQNLMQGIETLEALTLAIDQLASEISAYDTKAQRLTEEKEEAARAASAADTMYQTAKQNLETAKTAAQEALADWNRSFGAAGFETEEEYVTYLWDKEALNERNEAVIRFRSELATAKKDYEEKNAKLAGRTKPQLEVLKAGKEAMEGEVTSRHNRLGQEESNQKRLATLYQNVSKEYEKYVKEEEVVAKDTEFLNKLIPMSGVSFQRYVLGVMFGSVIEAANRLLEKVQGGRYRLSRTDETSKGNQGGLELAVFDERNGQSRGVVSLSGGEKFLVALSLAIGLSTIIQAQSHGIRLEAMFIDEGFGSLDEKSIGEAVEVLSTVQAGHGLVGVISHVEKLRGILPYCIEVFHGEKGNYIGKG